MTSEVGSYGPAYDATFAAIGIRLLASAVDVGICLAGLLTAVALLGRGFQSVLSPHWLLWSNPILAVGCFLTGWWEERRWGATVGKRMFRVHVVADDLGACSTRAAASRNLCKGFTILVPVSVVLTLVAMWLSRRRQRIGDRIARTLVVKTVN